jgi:hypothetical protein
MASWFVNLKAFFLNGPVLGLRPSQFSARQEPEWAWPGPLAFQGFSGPCCSHVWPRAGLQAPGLALECGRSVRPLSRRSSVNRDLSTRIEAA